MLLRKPDFYDSFKCIASKCSDTCCVGWEIDVDEASQEAYRNVSGVFGDRLRSYIEDGHFKLLPHDRCPFLDRENLCEIYRNLGEGALCDICREHPRFVEVYGDIMERGLGLCCEEAARLLLAGEGPLSFVNEECDEPEDDLDDDDREIRDEVLGERERMLGTLASNSVHFTDKLESVFAYNGKDPFFPFKSAHDMYELLAKTESFGPAPECQFSETESLRLIAYLIYRHYAKCLFEGREQGKLFFALFFWNAARLFAGELGGKINAIKMLSRQLEYCEENMVLIESALEKLITEQQNNL